MRAVNHFRWCFWADKSIRVSSLSTNGLGGPCGAFSRMFDSYRWPSRSFLMASLWKIKKTFRPESRVLSKSDFNRRRNNTEWRSFPDNSEESSIFLAFAPKNLAHFPRASGKKRKERKTLRRRGIFEKLSAKTYDFHPPKRKRNILFYAVPYEMIFPFFLVCEIPTPHSSPWLALVRWKFASFSGFFLRAHLFKLKASRKLGDNWKVSWKLADSFCSYDNVEWLVSELECRQWGTKSQSDL